MTEEWYFTIIEPVVEDSSESEEEPETSEEYITIPILNSKVSKNALFVSAILCIVAFLLILIPWLLYFIWSKRSPSSGTQVTQIQPMVQSSTSPLDQNQTDSGFYTRQGFPEGQAS